MTIPSKLQPCFMAGVPLLEILDSDGAKVITKANAGSVCAAGDASRFAAAGLQMAAMQAEQRHQLRVNGRAFAQKKFGPMLLMDRLEELLHQAVNIYKKPKVMA